MTRRRTVIWLPWLLGALTLLVLANMIPDGVNLLNVTPQLIIMVGVVAFMANVEVPLQGDGISLGYPAALLTYLTINGVGHKYEAFGAVAVGGAIGGLLRALWRNRELGKLWQPTLRLLNWPLLA